MTSYKSVDADGNCLFCAIIRGQIQTPGVFWEDDNFMAWLSIDPNTEGFSCVVPKEHFDSDILKMPDKKLSQFIIAAKKASRILEDYFPDVGRVGLIMEGTGINHAHIKLSPMHGTGFLKNGGWKQVLSGKQFWFDKYEGWLSSGSGPVADQEKLRQLAHDIKAFQKNNLKHNK